MSDASLEIEIKTLVDRYGADEAARALDKFKDGARESSHEVNVFNTHGREMHRLIHEMDRVVPGLGLGLRAAFHPEAIGIAALVIGLELVREAFKKHREELEKIRESAAHVWVEQQNAIEAGRKSLEDYTHSLEKTKDAQHELNDAFTEQNKIMEAVIQQREALDHQDKTVGEAAKLTQMQSQLSDLKRLAPGLETIGGDVARRKAAAEADDIAAQAAGRMAKQDEDKLKAAATAAGDVDELRKRVELAKSVQVTSGLGAQGSSVAVAQAEANLQAARTAHGALDAYMADKEVVEGHKRIVDRLNEEQQKAVTAIKENREAIEKMTKQIETGTTVLGIHRQTEAGLRAQGVATAAGGNVLNIPANEIEGFLRDTGRQPDQIAAMLYQIVNHTKYMNTVLAAMQRTVDSLVGTRKANPPGM